MVDFLVLLDKEEKGRSPLPFSDGPLPSLGSQRLTLHLRHPSISDINLKLLFIATLVRPLLQPPNVLIVSVKTISLASALCKG